MELPETVNTTQSVDKGNVDVSLKSSTEISSDMSQSNSTLEPSNNRGSVDSDNTDLIVNSKNCTSINECSKPQQNTDESTHSENNSSLLDVPEKINSEEKEESLEKSQSSSDDRVHLNNIDNSQNDSKQDKLKESQVVPDIENSNNIENKSDQVETKNSSDSTKESSLNESTIDENEDHEKQSTSVHKENSEESRTECLEESLTKIPDKTQTENLDTCQTEDAVESRTENSEDGRTKSPIENRTKSPIENRTESPIANRTKNAEERTTENSKESLKENLAESQTENLEASRTKDLEESQTKDVEESRAKDLEESRAKDLEESRAKDLEESRAKDLEESRAKDLEESRAKDLEESRAKDLEESRAKALEESRAKDLEESQTKDLEESRAKDPEESRAKDLEESRTENLEENETENPVFVHVNTETEKDDGDKNRSDGDRQDDEDFNSSQPQEDPIPSDDFAPMQLGEENEDVEQGGDEEQGANEELCIIPDTERIISQEEKEAAASITPLRDPADGEPKEKDSEMPDTIATCPLQDSSAEKYMISQYTEDSVNPCKQCCLIRKPQFSLRNMDNEFYVCDERCLTEFKEINKDKVFVHTNTEGDLRVKNLSSSVNDDNMMAKVNFNRKCMACEKGIEDGDSNLSWETMEFCNELCLSKYQRKIGSKCANCKVNVRSNCMGKYCVRFGYNIRQFCSGPCLEEYKKGLKVCSYCQKDMSKGVEGFLAPVGDKGQFKDFCSQKCMQKYGVMSNNRDSSVPSVISKCSVCLEEKHITVEYEHDGKISSFCGELCFVAFKFVNNITPGKCDMCRKYFDNKLLEQYAIYYDNGQHNFCSISCQNIYIIRHRKIVPCNWCKVKKYNFDMVKRPLNNEVLMFCSLNCLSLYMVSMSAVHSKKVTCDHCQTNTQPLYHLTMSDATIRNFCSYSCVMTFQNQFSKTITFSEPDESSAPVPTSAPRKSKRLAENSSEISPTIPVITSVESLAPNGETPSSPERGSETSNDLDAGASTSGTVAPVRERIIVKPAPIPPQRNKGVMCKTITSNKSVSCGPTTASKGVQTDEVQQKTALVPIPVPIYVPTPMCLYSLPFPVPFPIPLPIPVPIFIPTTRNSANGIMKEIKKIQVKIPTDPFEAELLMMAEMVAEDKKEDNTDSESEEEDNNAPDEGTFSPEPVDASNTFGDDMLQMALKMATELEEPAVDLEGALTANTITATQSGDTGGNETIEDSQPISQMIERQSVRGRKRAGRPPRSGGGGKRGRRSTNQIDVSMIAPQQSNLPAEPIEKPDANMCLKYTFGVNAWKQWVTTKNSELEKTSRRVKLFKTEILQLTADELNYSLCLFVKEVRKPNGQEYAPDTIYYLCLGIQQYLFENGRIDNIFCDAYYEKFTDCLDEVARKFSILYNDSHYIVTRVEEEHLWESKQLGAHSPHVLLTTLMFFNTKHFNLTSVDEHMQLSFSHIMKHWKRNPNQPGTNKVAGSRNVLLRFYPPQNTNESTRKRKVYEQQENEDNPLRCPVKLYEFYLSKCPESVKTRNDVFYLLPERSCVPDSPVWYSTMPLPKPALEKMLHRVKMVKEINVALLTS